MDHSFLRAARLRRRVWPVPPVNFFQRVDNGPYYLAFVADYLYGCALAAHALFCVVFFAVGVPLLRSLSNRIRVFAGLLLAAYLAGLTFVCLIVHFLSQATRRAQQRVEELARTDFLTGLHNRRSMIEKLDTCRADYERNGTPFGIIIGDLDDFKRVNDRYGHEAGDQMLRAIADTVGRCLRPTDSLGRWGGEEFLVLLPNTERKDVNRVAGRILETVRTVGGDVEDGTVGISISLGSTTYRPPEDISSLVARAYSDCKPKRRDTFVLELFKAIEDKFA